jgi:hypothetical protein
MARRLPLPALAASRSRFSAASTSSRFVAAATARSAACRTWAAFVGTCGGGVMADGGLAGPSSDSSGSRSTLYFRAASALSQNQLAFSIALRGTPWSVKKARSLRSGTAQSRSSCTTILSCLTCSSSLGSDILSFAARSSARFKRSSATLWATLRTGESGERVGA